MNTNRFKILTGVLLILAGITFWLSWYLMPDPGTVDSAHILAIVKQSRMSVFSSVIVQIVSSILYTIAFFSLIQIVFPPRRYTSIGIVLAAIGVLGFCSDAFFHLLAYYMTDDSINIQENVVRVMHFMQTGGVIFLIPLLLPFLIGSILFAIGLNQQRIVSKIPAILFIVVPIFGFLGSVTAKKIFLYQGNLVSLMALGLFALGHAWIGWELISSSEK
ncbi:putative membrane protein [Leptospira weilii serovar Ranarum str. ICFT]|uniref:Membrane protein n=1 Tax=Leptospira weilii serovar Ranarum str. ICFT TaxID=1218598 RepID=N1WHS0_9LEPT|nr:hypothetical protein [Leptospira weilii]EMY76684.1 putative membrane protein [Leptospira weilii serovar Ranarum str. ICFT]